MKRNTGKPSEEIFETQIRKNGKSCFLHRLTDSSDIRGLNGKGHAPKQPADYVLTLNGAMAYAEVKSTTHPTRFSLSLIKASQWQAAVRQHAAGGAYLFFIHSLFTKAWYVIPISFLLENPSKKSWSWTELQFAKTDWS